MTGHGEKWRRETADVQYKTPAVEKLLIKYQQPDEADKMNKIQKEIGTLLPHVLHVRVCACVRCVYSHTHVPGLTNNAVVGNVSCSFPNVLSTQRAGLLDVYAHHPTLPWRSVM